MAGMGEGAQDRPRMDPTDTTGRSAGDSGWTTTDTAAKALDVTPRTVRRFIDRGDLEGRKVREGIVEAWEVSINSLYSLRDKRLASGHDRRDVPRKSATTDAGADASSDMADIVRDLTADLVRAASEATELRVRLELTERTESSLREDLQRERERADRFEAERERREQAERERDELRRRLEALEEDRPLPEPRDAPEKASEEVSEEVSEWVDAPTPLTESPEGSAERRGSSWWRRLFGFDDRGSW
jgi:hypothetical protein